MRSHETEAALRSELRVAAANGDAAAAASSAEKRELSVQIGKMMWVAAPNLMLMLMLMLMLIQNSDGSAL
jgi:hypothetical protein